MSERPFTQERRQATTPSSPPHFYHVYGLTLASQLELPELAPIPDPVVPDAEIRCTTVPDELEGATRHSSWLQTTADECQILIAGIASFRITRGRIIEVDRRILKTTGPGRSIGDVRLFLLGTALGTLIHQRNWLPLHISAVDTPFGVWAFTGPSGAGKSTTAAFLHYRRGWPLVSDDVAVIKPEDSLPYLFAGPPRLKLWKDALMALQIDPVDLTQDFTLTEKYHLRMHAQYLDQPHPLHALVLLDRSDADQPAHLERLQGVDAFQAIMASLYRPEVGTLFQSPASLLLKCARIANQIKVFRYRRPWVPSAIDSTLLPLITEIENSQQR